MSADTRTPFEKAMDDNAVMTTRLGPPELNPQPFKPETRIDRLRQERDELLKALKQYGTRAHYYCEDPWYSCPKAPDGCCNDAEGTDCNCGADGHNAAVNALLARLDAGEG